MPLQADLERLRLGEGPTPVRELTQLGEERGSAPVWIKDDGAYSRFGGNKARKLEWLLADARRRGKRTILTGGALGTNHGLATALFARRLGMRTVLVLVPQPETEHVRRQLERIRPSGAEIHLARGVARAYAVAASLMLRRASPPVNLPYFLRPGGSVPLGCVGYVEAAIELSEQVQAGDAAGALAHRRSPRQRRHRRRAARRPEAHRPALAPRRRARQRPDPGRRANRRQAG